MCMQTDPTAAQAEALASLPQEPSGGDSCRVRVRLPDGSSAVRSFLKSHPLETLRTFCVASSLEAAGGRAFNIVQAGHGISPPPPPFGRAFKIVQAGHGFPTPLPFGRLLAA